LPLATRKAFYEIFQRRVCLKIVLTTAMSLSVVSARAYSKPPSWNPMLMLSVTLNESNQLAVEATAYIAPLTNAPGTYDSTNRTYDLDFVSFDPTQTYAVLNGTAYSRVLGWYDGINDDFYTTYAAQLKGTNYVWIEKIAGSPELKTYAVTEAGNPNMPYTPIFGTAGSSTKWLWDGFMDHNANAVDLKCLNQSNQLFTATYHLYIGDTNGNTNTNFGDTTTTWSWKGPAVAVVPVPGIAWTNSQLIVSWPPTVTNLTLVSVDSLAETNWIAVTNAPVLLNGKATVILEPASTGKFFRLRLVP
jgi:membrane peptidoglycan carboxypeptidase